MNATATITRSLRDLHRHRPAGRPARVTERFILVTPARRAVPPMLAGRFNGLGVLSVAERPPLVAGRFNARKHVIRTPFYVTE